MTDTDCAHEFSYWDGDTRVCQACEAALEHRQELGPLTLWKMLRKHGVSLYTSQMICNDVMLNGVTLPQSPQVTEQPHE
jgi:hypothetical protein